MRHYIQIISLISIGGFLRIKKTKQKVPIGAMVKFSLFTSEKNGEGPAQTKSHTLLLTASVES